jgi:uncharacterized membrane protein YsdA (DUF1294 family)
MMIENVPLTFVSNALIAGIMQGSAFPNFDPDYLIPLYLAWLLASGIISFVIYGYDKFKAVRGGYRVPENLLHVLALSGGFLGSALGMAVFRHKIRKTMFKAVIASAFFLHGFFLFSLLRV